MGFSVNNLFAISKIKKSFLKTDFSGKPFFEFENQFSSKINQFSKNKFFIFQFLVCGNFDDLKLHDSVRIDPRVLGQAAIADVEAAADGRCRGDNCVSHILLLLLQNVDVLLHVKMLNFKKNFVAFCRCFWFVKYNFLSIDLLHCSMPPFRQKIFYLFEENRTQGAPMNL